MGASAQGLEGIEWTSWKDRIHLADVTMVGHSFGAATTVEVLRHQERFQWVSQGVMYDIWGLALTAFQPDPGHRIRVSLLGINSEAFMYWPGNFKVARAICEETRDSGSLCWLMTVRGTVHISQSDFCILYPRKLTRIFKISVGVAERGDNLNYDRPLTSAEV